MERRTRTIEASDPAPRGADPGARRRGTPTPGPSRGWDEAIAVPEEPASALKIRTPVVFGRLE